MRNYFFEIPIYSMKQDTYENKLKQKLIREKAKYNLKKNNPNYELANEAIRKFAFREWNYNQIVGYLKLYRLGDNISADFWKIDNERIPFKLDKKVFKYQFISPEWDIDLSELKTSNEIYEKIIEELPNDCRELYKGYYLDLSILLEIGPYVNWKELINKKND
jgi:hypothetical protein